MSKNRTVAAIARELQENLGLKYTEALREAQHKVHLDILQNGNNGSISPEAAESWLPVLTQLKPIGDLQWKIVNMGPSINCFGLGDGYLEEVKYWVNVTGPVDSRHGNLYSAEDRLEDLVSDDSPGGVFDSLQDAYTVRISSGETGEAISIIDLRKLNPKMNRAEAIVSFLNMHVA